MSWDSVEVKCFLIEFEKAPAKSGNSKSCWCNLLKICISQESNLQESRPKCQIVQIDSVFWSHETWKKRSHQSLAGFLSGCLYPFTTSASIKALSQHTRAVMKPESMCEYIYLSTHSSSSIKRMLVTDLLLRSPLLPSYWLLETF